MSTLNFYQKNRYEIILGIVLLSLFLLIEIGWKMGLFSPSLKKTIEQYTAYQLCQSSRSDHCNSSSIQVTIDSANKLTPLDYGYSNLHQKVDNISQIKQINYTVISTSNRGEMDKYQMSNRFAMIDGRWFEEEYLQSPTNLMHWYNILNPDRR